MQMSSSSGGGGSKMMSPKLLTTVLIIFSTLSFIKLLLLTNSSSAAPAVRPRRSAWDSGGGGNGTAKNGLAAKELTLLCSVVAARASCRLLVFGLFPQLLALAALNSGKGAVTAFVTDNTEDGDTTRRVLVGRGAGAGAGTATVHWARNFQRGMCPSFAVRIKIINSIPIPAKMAGTYHTGIQSSTQ